MYVCVCVLICSMCLFNRFAHSAGPGWVSNKSGQQQSNRPTEEQSNKPTKRQSNSPTQQSNNLSTQQPNNPATHRSRRPTDQGSNRPTDLQINSATNQQNNNRTIQLNNPTTHQPNNPTTQQPNNPTTNRQPNHPTTQQPRNKATQQLKNPRTQEPNNTTTQQPKKIEYLPKQKTHTHTQQKNYQNWWNWSQGDPKWSQNSPESLGYHPRKSRIPPRGWYPRLRVAPKLLWFNDAHLFGRIFGSPGGPQNRPKIDPWPQKGRQEAIFYRFFSRTAFVSLLGLIFHRFLMIFWSKNRCIFPKPRAIFSTWRWPKSMHRRSVLSTFYFFHFFWNLWKNDAKNQAKQVIKKNIEK